MKPSTLRRLVGLALIMTACSMDDDDRRKMLKTTEHTNYQIVRGTVVRDLAAPTDTGRLIYDPPQNLSERAAAAIGNTQLWAPFGIAAPDSTASPATRR